MGRSSATLQASPRPTTVESGSHAREGHRDTVEAIVVAFILALVVPRVRGPSFRDPDRVDGSDLDGPAQGDRLSRSAVMSTRSTLRRKSSSEVLFRGPSIRVSAGTADTRLGSTTLRASKVTGFS